MKSKLFGPILIILILSLLSIGVIIYARGYRIDFKKRGLKTTGLLAVNSDPKGASVFLNERLVSATNDTLDLEPGSYHLRLSKEGYFPWEKELEIKKEVVVEINARLFPSNPSLSPLTTSGAQNPSLSPDGTKLAFIIPYTRHETRDTKHDNCGVSILDLNNHPLSFSRQPSQIFSYKISPQEKARLLWSPDSTQVLFWTEKAAFLLNLNQKNQSPPNLIGTLSSLFKTWQEEKKQLEEKKLLALPEPLNQFFSKKTQIISWAPDESKILYQATASATISKVIAPPLLSTNPTKEVREVEPEKIYVYDQKEDRNYEIAEADSPGVGLDSPGVDASETRESASRKPRLTRQELASEAMKWNSLQWLPTSRHLILTEEGQISILEYDGTNKATVYANAFEENFVAPYPDASKLIILISLNPAAATLPNLYTLSLR